MNRFEVKEVNEALNACIKCLDTIEVPKVKKYTPLHALIGVVTSIAVLILGLPVNKLDEALGYSVTPASITLLSMVALPLLLNSIINESNRRKRVVSVFCLREMKKYIWQIGRILSDKDSDIHFEVLELELPISMLLYQLEDIELTKEYYLKRLLSSLRDLFGYINSLEQEMGVAVCISAPDRLAETIEKKWGNQYA